MRVVSDHAVVRYLERLEGFALTDCFPDLRDHIRAELGAALLDTTVDALRDQVCPPRLHAALRLGDGYVRAGDRTLAIRNGVVTTCMRPSRRQKRRRIRECVA